VEIPLPSLRIGLSIALILVGLLMLVEARRGFHGGLIALAIVLTVILGAGSITNMNLAVDGAFGDQRHQVTSAADLQRDYSHAFGSLTVDLRSLDLPAGTTRIKVSVAFGEATVIMPSDIPYRLEGSSVFGGIEAPDFNTAGIASNRTFTSAGYEGAESRLDIEIAAAFGTGRVR